MAVEMNNTSAAVTSNEKPQLAREGSGSSLFSEILESGGEIEGMFQRRKQEQEKKSSKKSLSNGLKDPVVVLRERIAIYNKKKENLYHLSLNEEDFSYYGFLTFHCNNGYQTFTDKIQVQSFDTASKLVPVLLSLFIPQCELNLPQYEANNSYILLTQGGTERELDRTEKPLEIALDCSVKGLSQPTFTLKTSLSYLQLPNTPQNLRKKLSSSTSLAASSHSSLGHCSSEGSESPRVIEARLMEDSLYSYDVPSNFYTHPPRSSPNMPRSIFKSRSQTNAAAKSHKALEQVHSKLSDTSLGSPTGHLTPENGQKTWNRSKSKVGNFMEGVARSLKSKRKPRPTLIYPEDDEKRQVTMTSPVLTEKSISMPTVFHIHFPSAKNAQLYKSVLVSECSTTREVIKQALERYSMKFADPSDFALLEVIGKWEKVVMETLDSDLERSLNALITPLSPGNTLERAVTTPAYEEFVVYYRRELGLEEQPYNVQFFHQAPPGYTRRFELKSKHKEECEETKSSEALSSMTPVFGVTSHRKRDKNQMEVCSTEDLTFNFSNSPIPVKKSTNESKDESLEAKSAPTLSFLDCSSPDSGLDLKTTTKLSDQTEMLYPSELGLSNVYLLNLQFTQNKKEFFVYLLSHPKTMFTTNESGPEPSKDGYHKIKLQAKEGPVLCCLHKEDPAHLVYSLEPHSATILINGAQISSPTQLHHGDLIQIGKTHLFMFHSLEGSYSEWPYRWHPIKTQGDSTPIHKPIGEVRENVKQFSEVVVVDTASHVEQPSPAARVVYVSPTRDDRLDRSPLPTVQEVDSSDDHEESVDGKPNLSKYDRVRSYSDSKTKQMSAGRSGSNTRSTSSFLKQQKRTGAVPSDRKIVFSYAPAEEDLLLDILIRKLDPMAVQFKLAPVYVISMCLEYNLKCHGPETAGKFACQVVSSIQQVIWELSNQTMYWQPPQNSKAPLKDIYSLLYSTLFWFSNCLEIYSYLLTKESLDLVMSVPGEENEQESALTLLENMTQQLFQQVFYPVSKILYYSLPMMLEEALYSDSQEANEGVYQSVECLKELLDMMLELHVHTEMIANFFANVFFFINGAMFNMFIEQGPEMGLFEYSKGIKLRTSLDILEGWAGKVGFREIILQFLGTFSSAIDLIAISPQELTTLSWENLRNEFPCLHSSQLHFILNNYILPDEVKDCITQWTPTINDSWDAINEEKLRESFDSHPEFYFPINGYSMEISNPPQDGELLHNFVDCLHKQLKKNATNKKKIERAAPVQALANSSTTAPASPLRKPMLDVSDIVRESPDFTKSAKKLKSAEKGGPHYSHKAIRRQKGSKIKAIELRGRVQSIVEPKLLAAPEMLLINIEDENEIVTESSSNSLDEEDVEHWVRQKFPKDCRVISLQRGNRGFGFNLERKKGVAGLFIKSNGEQIQEEELFKDVHDGDQVLAIDSLLVSETDYSLIQKYIKEAEEELTIVLAPQQ